MSDDNRCKNCGSDILTMTYRGTGYCSDICTRSATNIEEVRNAEKKVYGERSSR